METNILTMKYHIFQNSIVPYAIKVQINLDIELTDKTHGIVNNRGSALFKRRALILGSKETDTISNSYMARIKIFT